MVASTKPALGEANGGAKGENEILSTSLTRFE
jgi:hypothetical protein